MTTDISMAIMSLTALRSTHLWHAAGGILNLSILIAVIRKHSLWMSSLNWVHESVALCVFYWEQYGCQWLTTFWDDDGDGGHYIVTWPRHHMSPRREREKKCYILTNVDTLFTFKYFDPCRAEIISINIEYIGLFPLFATAIWHM